MKRILIISSSPRRKGNSQALCQEFERGAKEAGHDVELIRLAEKKISGCRACDGCMRNGGVCVIKDDMGELLEKFKNADVLVFATPIYFYGISSQMKTFIDRTYPIWQEYGKKEVYYLISAGLGRDIIERSLGDLDGLVDHFEEPCVNGRVYATNIMEAGKVIGTPAMGEAYNLGKSITP